MSADPLILGISSATHNGSACLLRGDRIVAAVQEERLTRVKRDALRPDTRSLAVDYCLAAGSVHPRDLDAVVDCSITAPGEDPLERARGWPVVQEAASRLEVLSISHHLGHAYSVFATSGFDDALVLVIDGGGSFGDQLNAAERAACGHFADSLCEHLSIYRAGANGMEPLEEKLSAMPYLARLPGTGMPHFASLGHMFSSVSWQLFGDYHAAGKVMALASFAEPSIAVEEFVLVDGPELAFPCTVVERFRDCAGWPAYHERYADLSASVQRALESALTAIRDRILATWRPERLCYAGGVALNGVANRRVLLDSGPREVHITPAADDAGPAIGAAFYGRARLAGDARGPRLRTDSLGRRYARDEVEAAVAGLPGVRSLPGDALDGAASLLDGGQLVGWFHGGAEFGPRALGGRNILCDPRLRGAQDLLNRVKAREPFRPFAPAVLAEKVPDWFEVETASRPMEFMLDVCMVRPALRATVPAIVHLDGSARPHAVRRRHSPAFYELISRFCERTGVPMVVSTSMNVSGEPIVETPREALWLLLTTDVDACVTEHLLVAKTPEFGSVLDLWPVCTGRLFVRERGGAARVVARTPHGTVERTVEPAHAEWLLTLDGSAPVREILDGGASLDADEAATLLGWLYKHSLVDFEVGGA